ncbi:hypothetical protein HIJ39_15665, partial [Sulfobacillus sp. DSM 109850]|nr:hypothetical protein [Sulfobacillus harzensis]
ITQNEQWMDELMALGASATPTTVIEWDDQREVIVGFNQAKLTDLLLQDDSQRRVTPETWPLGTARACGGETAALLSDGAAVYFLNVVNHGRLGVAP